MKAIDNFLNSVTMYRLVIYELFFLLAAGFVISFFGILPFAPLYLLYSVVFIFAISWAVNAAFARAFSAPSNPDSIYITAFILALIITPPSGLLDTHYLALAFWASAWAMASKYIIAIHKKHIFNPAALGVGMTAVVLGLSASWWVGTPLLVPFVLAGGLLIIRKLRRFDSLWGSFIGVFAAGTLYEGYAAGHPFLSTVSHAFLYAPAFFFATVMLTEPATAPPDKFYKTIYGILVALLFLPDTHFGTFYFSPEYALLVGNIFAYIVSPKYKLRLILKETIQLSRDVYEFVFSLPRAVVFAPGQYMEWTLPHEKPDLRGIRRYFTVASSPTENEFRLGIKFYERSSSYKKALRAMRPGDSLMAAQLAGDFTLPKDKSTKLAFIAGGIGSTPFRSMTKYLLDKGEKRDIVFLYSNRAPGDAVYDDIFERAKALGMRRVHAYTDQGVSLPPNSVRTLNAQTVAEHIPDFRERTFFVSGPQKMVDAFDEMLRAMGVKRSRIKSDYFPGFA